MQPITDDELRALLAKNPEELKINCSKLSDVAFSCLDKADKLVYLFLMNYTNFNQHTVEHLNLSPNLTCLQLLIPTCTPKLRKQIKFPDIKHVTIL